MKALAYLTRQAMKLRVEAKKDDEVIVDHFEGEACEDDEDEIESEDENCNDVDEEDYYFCWYETRFDQLDEIAMFREALTTVQRSSTERFNSLMGCLDQEDHQSMTNCFNMISA